MLDALRLVVENGHWRAYFTVDGIAYRRTLGAADTLTEVREAKRAEMWGHRRCDG